MTEHLINYANGHYKEYIDFVWHAQNIYGYGDWRCCDRNLSVFNEWLRAANLEPITMEVMIDMERKLIDSGINMETLYE